MRSPRSTTTTARAASRAAARACVENLAEGRSAVQSPDTFEQSRDAGHLAFTLARPRRRDRLFQGVSGARGAVGQRHLHAVLGNGEAINQLALNLGLNLAANFTRSHVTVFGARHGDRLVHGGADARFGIGDARLRGLLRFGKCGFTRGTSGGLAIRCGFVHHLCYECAQHLVNGGPDPIFERHFVSRPGVGLWGRRQRLGFARDARVWAL